MSGALPRPGVAPGRPWSFPVPRQSVLDNGVRVWLYDLPSQHVLSAQVVMDAPVGCEPESLEGLATMTVRTSDEGSVQHPGAQLAELVEDLGAVYSGTADQGATVCRLEVPSLRLAPALTLLAEIIRHPAHADEDVARHVSLRLAEIEQSMARSSFLAQLAFQKAVFDPAGRMSRPTGGSHQQVAAITRDDVSAFHGRWWRPDGATVIVAGALPGDIDQLVAQAFDQWQPTGELAPHRKNLPNPAGPVVWVVDRPGSVQADIQIGTFGPDRGDARWPALEVAACAVGGSFSSRLNTVLREELGYTYGAHASFRPLRDAGTFAVRTSCRTDVAAAATAQGMELLGLADRPLTDVEVSDARTYLLGVAPLHYQTAETIADQAATLAGAALPPSWINEHQTRVASITADQASEAFVEVVRPEDLTVVLCGDAAQLVPDLARHGLMAQVVNLQG